MAIKIKAYEFEGTKYVSVDTINADGKWIERAFEYTDNDKLETILALIEKAVNEVTEHDSSR